MSWVCFAARALAVLAWPPPARPPRAGPWQNAQRGRWLGWRVRAIARAQVPALLAAHHWIAGLYRVARLPSHRQAGWARHDPAPEQQTVPLNERDSAGSQKSERSVPHVHVAPAPGASSWRAAICMPWSRCSRHADGLHGGGTGPRLGVGLVVRYAHGVLPRDGADAALLVPDYAPQLLRQGVVR